MNFTKMHGCGNDYIYFDCIKEAFPGDESLEKKAAIELSQRHFGIGGDGIILIKKGLLPVLEPKRIPVKIEKELNPVINYPLVVQGTEYKITCVSMGNPHAVVFMNKKPDDLNINQIGPYFENHKAFPERTNTEFAFVQDRRTIWMRVWERGTGETLACGTGTCATVVAAILNGLVDAGEKITVHLLGGDLQIEWSGQETDSVFMTGPATFVCDGELYLPDRVLA